MKPNEMSPVLKEQLEEQALIEIMILTVRNMPILPHPMVLEDLFGKDWKKMLEQEDDS